MFGKESVNKYSKIWTRAHIGLNESANGNGLFQQEKKKRKKEKKSEKKRKKVFSTVKN